MPDDKQWLTPRDAARLSGRGVKSIRIRLENKNHPDHIPHYAHPSEDGRTIRLIDRKSFLAWLEAHAS